MAIPRNGALTDCAGKSFVVSSSFYFVKNVQHDFETFRLLMFCVMVSQLT